MQYGKLELEHIGLRSRTTIIDNQYVGYRIGAYIHHGPQSYDIEDIAKSKEVFGSRQAALRHIAVGGEINWLLERQDRIIDRFAPIAFQSVNVLHSAIPPDTPLAVKDWNHAIEIFELGIPVSVIIDDDPDIRGCGSCIRSQRLRQVLRGMRLNG